MTGTIAITLSIALGAGAGWIARATFTRPLTRDLVATVLGWFVGSVTTDVVILAGAFHPISESGGLGAVSVGFSEAIVIGLPIAIMLAIVLRLAIRHLKAAPVLLGGLGGLVGAMVVLLT